MMGGVCMEQNKRQVLGILGGLGPAASCYLYQMLIDFYAKDCIIKIHLTDLGTLHIINSYCSH